MIFGIVGGLLLDFGLSGDGFSCFDSGGAVLPGQLTGTGLSAGKHCHGCVHGDLTAGIVICLQWVFLYYFRGYSFAGVCFYAPSSAQIFLHAPVFPLVYLLNKGLFQALQDRMRRHSVVQQERG